MSGRKRQERRQKPGAEHFTLEGERQKNTMTDRGYKLEKLVPQTQNQGFYIRTIRRSDVTLCHGPPGTGKTHIAIGVAVQMIRSKEIEKIIICRPVVPVGRDIGYLPGGMEDKLGPYLRPLFDELSVYCEESLLKIWMDTKKLEIVPLSMMRGRTFKNAFVIMDEAQNATYAELKMFLTRFGLGAKVVVTGDLNQSDLPRHLAGDYECVIDDLEGLSKLEIVELTKADIVRHELTGQIEDRLSRRS